MNQIFRWPPAGLISPRHRAILGARLRAGSLTRYDYATLDLLQMQINRNANRMRKLFGAPTPG